MTQNKQTTTNSKSSTTKLSDFKELVEIGHGAFGKVYRAIYIKNGKAYALKKISIKQIHDQHMISQLNTQIKISKSLDHPNIIKLYDTFEEEEYIYLVLELAQHGQLYSKLIKEGRFTERTAKLMIIDLIKAIQYLHSRSPPIIHRDIKPENILLDKNDKVKLADFGWSNFLNKPRKTYCGTFDYLAPQMIDKSGHDQKLDYWCLGVLVYELLTGRTPFLVNDPKKTQNPRKMLEDNILNVRLTFPDDFPTLAKSFVLGMVKRNPKERMNLNQIKNHIWLKQSVEEIQALPPTKSVSFIKNENKPIDNTSKTIIEELREQIRALEKELNQKKINQVKIQTPTNNGQYAAMLQQMRKLKVAEQMNENYQKDIDKLWGQLNNKQKQIITLKNMMKNYQELKQDYERYKNDKLALQQKIKKLQKELEVSEMAKKQLKQQLNKANENIQKRVRSGDRIKSSQLTSQQFINYLQDQLEIISEKFDASQSLLTKVLQREKLNEQKQDELIRLRVQQKTLRENIKAELKQHYETQMDNRILRARDELTEERQKWFKDLNELKSIYDGNNSTNGQESTKMTDRQQEVQQDLKNVKQLNSYYEKTIKVQQSQIKDLQQSLKRKK